MKAAPDWNRKTLSYFKTKFPDNNKWIITMVSTGHNKF